MSEKEIVLDSADVGISGGECTQETLQYNPIQRLRGTLGWKEFPSTRSVQAQSYFEESEIQRAIGVNESILGIEGCCSDNGEVAVFLVHTDSGQSIVKCNAFGHIEPILAHTDQDIHTLSISPDGDRIGWCLGLVSFIADLS
jgi:hypothetical protein